MCVTRFPLSRASRTERQLLEVLRGSGDHHAPFLPEDLPGALRDLAVKARAEGYSLWPVGSAHINGDEILLLGWLALLQRERPDLTLTIDRALLGDLAAVAGTLRKTRLLSHQAILRAGLVGAHTSTKGRGGHSRPPVGEPAPRDSKRVRAVALAREHGLVPAHALCALGLTRQYISVLREKGALVRVRHGYYAAPSDIPLRLDSPPIRRPRRSSPPL